MKTYKPIKEGENEISKGETFQRNPQEIPKIFILKIVQRTRGNWTV